MDTLTLRPDTPNVDIINAVRNSAGMDYRDRVPVATQGNLKNTMDMLLDWQPLHNEFCDVLINRIGLTEIRGMSTWDSPLKRFKRGMLRHGNTIQKIQVGLLKAKTYDTDVDYGDKMLFGRELPEVQTEYHTTNRREFYKVTVNRDMLSNAFVEEGALTGFIGEVVAAPAASDNWDEFVQTMQLFPIVESMGGFFKVQIPDVEHPDSTEKDAKEALRKIRTTLGNLRFPSRRYNAAKMPVHAQSKDVFIFCKPEFKNALDVNALAAAFNLDYAIVNEQFIEVPAEHFNIPGCQAIMVTDDFFVLADEVMTTDSIRNPANLHYSTFFHHHEVISASRFAQAIMFTTKPGTEIVELNPPVTGIEPIVINGRDGNPVTKVARGSLYQGVTKAVVEDVPEGMKLQDGVRWQVEDNTSSGTYVTQTGVLHVGGREGASEITVRATTTWLNPENLALDGHTAIKKVAVEGPAMPEWPVGQRPTGITVKTVKLADFDVNTKTYAVTVAGGTATAEDVIVHGVSPEYVSTTVSAVGKKLDIKVATPGNDVVYTVTVS